MLQSIIKLAAPSAVLLQAYGAKKYHLLGTIMQRAMLICSVAFCLIMCLWSQLNPILKAAGMSSTSAALQITISCMHVCYACKALQRSLQDLKGLHCH